MSARPAIKESDIIDIIEAIATPFFEDLAFDLQAALPKTVDATHYLRNSITFDLTISGSELRYQLLIADYYKNVDKGQKPGTRVEIQALKEWIVAKSKSQPAFARSFAANIVSKKGLKVSKVNDKALTAAAIGVARKIARSGTKGNDFYSSTVTKQRLSLLAKELEGALGASVKLSISKV